MFLCLYCFVRGVWAQIHITLANRDGAAEQTHGNLSMNVNDDETRPHHDSMWCTSKMSKAMACRWYSPSPPPNRKLWSTVCLSAHYSHISNICAHANRWAPDFSACFWVEMFGREFIAGIWWVATNAHTLTHKLTIYNIKYKYMWNRFVYMFFFGACVCFELILWMDLANGTCSR